MAEITANTGLIAGSTGLIVGTGAKVGLGLYVLSLVFNQLNSLIFLFSIFFKMINNKNKCQIMNHDEKTILAICFDTKCQQKGVSCQICQKEFHNDHFGQVIELDFLMKFIKTHSENEVDPHVKQTLQELAQIQKYLEELQKFINIEMERLTQSSLQSVCKTIGTQYKILKDLGQGLENQKLNQLAQDMLKNFEVQNCRIHIKETVITQQGQDFQKFLNQFSQAMTKIENTLKNINKIFESKDKQVNFEAFTEQQLLTGHTSLVRGIDICKQRNLLASGGCDKNVKLWDLKNHQLIKTYSYSGTVFDVVFSNQGNLLAFGGDYGDYSIKLIDISDMKKDNVQIDLKGHTSRISRLTFSNDSKYLISGSSDKKIIFWDVILKKESFQLNLESRVCGVAINSDDTLITSNSDDGKIKIWTIQNRKLLCTRQAHTNGAGINFSNDPKMLASSGWDGSIKLWSLKKLNQSQLLLIREFKATTNSIWTVLFSPCSRFIICMSLEDREIKVLDSLTGEVVKLFKSKALNQGNFITQVAISKDMDIIAYGEDDNIAVWTRK